MTSFFYLALSLTFWPVAFCAPAVTFNVSTRNVQQTDLNLTAAAITNTAATANALAKYNANKRLLSASQGTDYYAPAGTDVAVADGGTGSSTAAGALDNLATAETSIASAASTAIGGVASQRILITGTTTITSFGTIASGVVREGRFQDALTLTHNATSLILPSAASITTAANDRFRAYSLGSGNWLVLFYQKADGTPLVSSGSSGGNWTSIPVTAVTTNYTVDSSLGYWFEIINPAANFGLIITNGPTGLTRREVLINIRQDSVGVRLVTLSGTNWIVGSGVYGDLTGVTLSTNAGAWDHMKVLCISNTFHVVGLARGYAAP